MRPTEFGDMLCPGVTMRGGGDQDQKDGGRAGTIASPCVDNCQLYPAGYCAGCGRTIDEISGWGRIAAAEKRAVLVACRRRLAQG